MTIPSLEAEPACTGPERVEAANPPPSAASHRRLRVTQTLFGDVARSDWDRLAARTEWATPFSDWAFHRAWWDAYGSSAHDQTLLVTDDSIGELVGIVPLMHRHEVEPTDADTHTKMRQSGSRRLTQVAPTAKAIFFGAAYHADYATFLAAPEDPPAVAEAIAEHLARPAPLDDAHPEPWDVVDLRRLRCGDPAADELAAAFGRREIAEGWTLNVEREDVCPVTTLPLGGDFDEFLATLGKKSRHEIRRKVRRAEGVGEIRLTDSADALTDLPEFIDLHQRRWGDDGLFPDTPGGEASRLFFRRMFEEHPAIRLAFLTVGDRRIAAGVHFRTRDGYLYYNAGVDPDARELSPGVLMVAAYIQRALAEGCRRMDFLRGNESYKYEWGAVDEPIQRLLVRRDAEAPG
jgi:CelD/BcsL family acetyltransferase involved in cellulose biosynthesis